MIKIKVSDIAEVVHGQVCVGGEEELRRVARGLTWDSREIEKGNIFLACPGERVDGNDFIRAAVTEGAAAVICTREPDTACKAIAGEFSCVLIHVLDGVVALTQLATWWRSKIRAMVIGVTGSTGKTSTKDFLYSVLSHKFSTVATAGNRNNEFGVPATILSADEDTEALIVEMGMRGLGQLEQICKMAKPNVGVVTNIGVCHMELLGSRENIARAKGEMLAALPDTGFAVVNADDDMTEKLLEFSGLNERGIMVRSFGKSENADVRAENIGTDAFACASFDLCFGDAEGIPVQLSIPGVHNVSNALAAATIAQYLGVSVDQIIVGLHAACGSGMRMELVHAPAGFSIVNDAYNANPDSMRASLDSLARMYCTGRHIAVLGDMGELGENEVELHKQTGVLAAKANPDLLVCIGELAKAIEAGAEGEGMDASAIIHFDTTDDALAYLRGEVRGGDLVLVKASRFMGLESIVEGLVS